MNQSPINFSKQLVKGRIAETLFEQMLRDAGGFTILAFGYENILPELAHRQHDLQAEETMEIIRRAPDFAVIDNKTHEVHLIEVKYRNHYSDEANLKVSQRMLESWKPSYLFMATPEGFYFDKVIDIVDRGGRMNQFKAFEHITVDLQKKYLNLLNQFIPEAVRHNGPDNSD
jgi:hypothetical protein